MPPTQHEAGLVADDQTVHAARKGISGSVAVCGAGRITEIVPGRFNTDEPDACPNCVRDAG